MSIFHIGTLHAKAEHTSRLIKSFDGLNQAPGYIAHKCYRDLDDRNKLTLVEEWVRKEDHENFINALPDEEMERWQNMLSQQGTDSYYKLI